MLLRYAGSTATGIADAGSMTVSARRLLVDGAIADLRKRIGISLTQHEKLAIIATTSRVGLTPMAPTRLLWTMIVMAGVGAIAPAQAKISASLANKCQAMAWQAHPATLPDIQATTNLRRNYYRFCIARRGIMDPMDPNKP
jgi:hypothetical protein